MDPGKLPPPVRGRARGRTSALAARTTSVVQVTSPSESTGATTQPVVAVASPVVSPAPVISTATVVSTPPVETVSSPQPSSSTPLAPGSSDKSAQETQTGVAKLSISEVESRYTYMVTRPTELHTKRSTDNPSLNLVANYFAASVPENWSIHQYTVSFDPPLEDEQTAIRKGLFRNVAPQLPSSLFDGLMLFTVKELPQCPTVLTTADKFTNKPVTITIDCHLAVDRRSPVCFQIYNIFVRKCLEYCSLTQMGRRYFDPKDKSELRSHFLEVWPGFATSLRYFENSLLLNVETVSKVIRTKSVFQIMSDIRTIHKGKKTDEEIKKLVAEEIEGRIVMTTYNNNRTYPIEKILWSEKASSTFPWKDGTTKDYATYYREKWGIELRHQNQPLLLVASKEKEIRRGKAPSVIKLVPEICYPTGLTDTMRANFQLMTDLGKIMHLQPTNRVTNLTNFIKRLIANTQIQEEMSKWEIKFDSTELVRVPGKQLKEEKIYQGEKAYGFEGFTKGLNFRAPLHQPLGMTSWLAVVPAMNENEFNMKFLKDFQTVSRGMNIQVAAPKVCKVAKLMGADYLNTIEAAIAEAKGKLDIIFIVLPNNKIELYSIIKQKLTKDWGIPSQCCLSKNLKKGMSVATKIAVQMSCKVGGVPWIIRNPFKEFICVMGFDVYHSGKIGGSSYGAIVATTNKELSKTCSFITGHKHRDEISTSMGSHVTNCLREYQKINGCLPTRIFFYRDGVGEGQVDIVYNTELKSVMEAINQMYSGKPPEDVAKLTYIIVSKRINTRFMLDSGNGKHFENPPPGTIVDDVVTLHYRYDFFLISQTARQGSVSPTNYNIIHDDNSLTPGRMQTFTYKLCHNYYNWNGTLSVPSMCQNAHKLAYITGEAIRGGCKDKLRHLPYYL